MAEPTYRVIWAEPAAADLCEIVRFVAAEAPMNAGRVLERLRQKADSLTQVPRRGRRIPELRELGTDDLREIIVAPYRLLYRVAEDRVTVLAVFDGRRHLEDVLYERLLRSG